MHASPNDATYHLQLRKYNLAMTHPFHCKRVWRARKYVGANHVEIDTVKAMLSKPRTVGRIIRKYTFAFIEDGVETFDHFEPLSVPHHLPRKRSRRGALTEFASSHEKLVNRHLCSLGLSKIEPNLLRAIRTSRHGVVENCLGLSAPLVMGLAKLALGFVWGW